MQRTTRLLLTIGLLASMSLGVRADPVPLVVHEWGTFTSLQNEAGETMGGINTDDEPVPAFVHRIDSSVLIRPTGIPLVYGSGEGVAPISNPDVTLRLETPVLYFHLPDGQGPLRGVTVQARFRGGWLSEFYPDAAAVAPGVTDRAVGFGRLRADTVGTLTWRDLEVGVEGAGPVTAAHVWNAPRAVQSQSVRTAGGETEKFLFYRGVAHIDAPLVAVQAAGDGQLVLRSRLPPELATRAPLQVSGAWLVDVRPDGAVAWRPVPPLTLGSAGGVSTVSMRFEPGDYAGANRAALSASLHQGLVAAGLFDDEARALLATWELSYFRSAGLRIFYLVPRAWTDFYLPLQVSVDARITRVMVGRIELVTPAERRELHDIGRMSAQAVEAGAHRLRKAIYARPRPADGQGLLTALAAGGSQLQASGLPLPAAYRRYLALGRFRNALVLDEAARHPTAGMKALISAYGLEAYRADEQPAIPVQASRR